MEGVFYVFVLLDIHFIILNHNHCPFVVVGPTIVRCAKNRNNGGEGLGTSPAMHFESLSLNLVCTYNWKVVVFLKNLFDWFETELYRTLTLTIFRKHNFHGLGVINRICPKDITEYSWKRRLDESINLVDLVNICNCGRNTTMHAQIVIIYSSR